MLFVVTLCLSTIYQMYINTLALYIYVIRFSQFFVNLKLYNVNIILLHIMLTNISFLNCIFIISA